MGLARGTGRLGVLWTGLMMAFVWLPLLLILVWALRQFGGPRRTEQPESNHLPPEVDAREIARRAYASGNIDRKRYPQIIENLEQTERDPVCGMQVDTKSAAGSVEHNGKTYYF